MKRVATATAKNEIEKVSLSISVQFTKGENMSYINNRMTKYRTDLIDGLRNRGFEYSQIKLK